MGRYFDKDDIRFFRIVAATAVITIAFIATVF